MVPYTGHEHHSVRFPQAANYLDIKPLLDLTCAKVATTLKGKTPEEIRIEYNIRNDFTPVSLHFSHCASLLRLCTQTPFRRRKRHKSARRTDGAKKPKLFPASPHRRLVALACAHKYIFTPTAVANARAHTARGT